MWHAFASLALICYTHSYWVIQYKEYFRKVSMPKAPTYTLIWSDDAGTYELHFQDGRSPRPLRVEDEHSFIRLVEGSSFAFQGKYGRLTLRKESRPHGRGEEGYWYA